MKPIITGWSFRAPPKVASPESITIGLWLWIPGSPAARRPGMTQHMIRTSKTLYYPPRVRGRVGCGGEVGPHGQKTA
jgi:hypothetical protein